MVRKLNSGEDAVNDAHSKALAGSINPAKVQNWCQLPASPDTPLTKRWPLTPSIGQPQAQLAARWGRDAPSDVHMGDSRWRDHERWALLRGSGVGRKLAVYHRDRSHDSTYLSLGFLPVGYISRNSAVNVRHFWRYER